MWACGCVAALLCAVALAPAPPPPTARSPAVVDTLLVSNGDPDTVYWLGRLFRLRLGRAERRCASRGRLLHATTKTCHAPLTQGPCREGKWLVADRVRATRARGPRRLVGFCRRRPDDQLCDPRTENFVHNLFGDGACQCKGFRTAGPDGKCHALLTQGPCDPGQALALSFNLTGFTSGVCVPSRCPDYKMPVQKEALGDIECRGLLSGEGEACNPAAVPLFTKEVDLKVPLCLDTNRGGVGSKLGMPSDCVRNDADECVPEATHGMESMEWM